ncbi:MAG TPA: CbiX/SirB N-terminal domain-containing protein [Macromonas sp.]|nr:CbiX/SirB N-terminal domain-containing protein [Macromonas sp.]
MKGVIVFAHGSRDPLWRLPMEAVAQAVRSREPQTLVSCAYLELCEPDLPAAAQDLVSRGADRIRVLPAFLGVGQHARQDLPELMAALRLAHPATEFELLPTAGEDQRVVALLAELAVGNEG